MDDFYNDFIELVTQDPNYQASYFDSLFYPKEIIKGVRKNIFEKKYDLQTDTNLLGLDLLGFQVFDDQKDMKKEGKSYNLKANVWAPKIALMHESDSKQWMIDLLDLVYVRCPYKVLIGYTKYDERDHELDMMNFAAKWLMRSEGFHIEDQEHYLLIIGNSGNKRVKDEMKNVMDYRGYYFDYHFMNFVPVDHASDNDENL